MSLVVTYCNRLITNSPSYYLVNYSSLVELRVRVMLIRFCLTYTVNHKKRDILFLTMASLNRFL